MTGKAEIIGAIIAILLINIWILILGDCSAPESCLANTIDGRLFIFIGLLYIGLVTVSAFTGAMIVGSISGTLKNSLRKIIREECNTRPKRRGGR